MKIILSRKGFDSSKNNGGIPSPILPDGTLLSLPIPSENDELSFNDMQYHEHKYSDILKLLAPGRQYDNCHLDPDIRTDVRVKATVDWKPAFGQIGAAQTYLSHKGLSAGDLFLFFGWFKQTTGSIADGTLRYVPKAPSLHIIFGYMEIAEIIMNDEIPEINYYWHPHGSGKRLEEKTNAMYLPAKKLTFDKTRCGWGVFDYSDKRVLTLAEKKATWREIPCLLPEWVDKNVKNNANGKGIYYQGVWQELVLKESQLADDWVKEIF